MPQVFEENAICVTIIPIYPKKRLIILCVLLRQEVKKLYINGKVILMQ
jgi:hypothetical protein